MRRYLVNWVHVLGGANNEYVTAISAEKAIEFIEMRQGASNLIRVVVINF